MKMHLKILLLPLGFALAACSGDTTRDTGLNSGPLSNMKAAIWIDPNGCDHWIIDDGLEGYMSPRLTPEGMPVCRDDYSVNTEGFQRRLFGRR